MLRNAGYATGLFGKWHLGSDPRFYPGNYGFDTSYGSLAGGVDPYHHHYKRGVHSTTWHRNGKLIHERGHATDLITEGALRWIVAQDQPWFCYVPYTAVHTPIRAPEPWIDRYWFGAYDYDPERERSFQEYAAYASHLDHAIGRLIEELKCLEQIHNTVVIFVSDNGASTKNVAADTNLYPGWHEDMPRRGSNDPLRGTKGTLYEGGIRTPAAIMWQSVLPPGKLTDAIHIVDWMPTFAALLGCEPPADPQWDGVDIWPLISGQMQHAPERPLYWNLVHERFAVRHRGWKLIRRERASRLETELYHIAADPLEERDLASTHPERVQALLSIWAAQREHDDSSKRSDVE
jgi:arylsulfatase A-like enzyme